MKTTKSTAQLNRELKAMRREIDERYVVPAIASKNNHELIHVMLAMAFAWARVAALLCAQKDNPATQLDKEIERIREIAAEEQADFAEFVTQQLQNVSGRVH